MRWSETNDICRIAGDTDDGCRAIDPCRTLFLRSGEPSDSIVHHNNNLGQCASAFGVHRGGFVTGQPETAVKNLTLPCDTLPQPQPSSLSCSWPEMPGSAISMLSESCSSKRRATYAPLRAAMHHCSSSRFAAGKTNTSAAKRAVAADSIPVCLPICGIHISRPLNGEQSFCRRVFC